MRLVGRICLAGLLSAGPSVFAAKAAVKQPLGVIEVSQNGHVNGTEAAPGSDFYGGEEFVTYESGSMQLRVRDCRIDLGATTDARFLPDAHPDHLLVIQGSARYSCPAGAVLWVDTPAGIVHGSEGMPASGMIVVNDAHDLVISAYGEGLILDNDGELHLIGGGQSYRVAVSDEYANAGTSGDGSPQAQKKHRRHKLALWLIGGGVAAFAAGEIWEEESESRTNPSLCPI
jgi:hypothetical protein